MFRGGWGVQYFKANLKGWLGLPALRFLSTFVKRPSHVAAVAWTNNKRKVERKYVKVRIMTISLDFQELRFWRAGLFRLLFSGSYLVLGKMKTKA